MNTTQDDPERIHDLVDRAGRIGQQIDGCLTDIEQLIATLQVEWDGEQPPADRKWNLEVREMSAALSQLESTVRSARDRYLGNIAHNTRS